MLKLTRKIDYALVALARLAASDVGEALPLSARQIATDHQMPTPLVTRLLKDLQRAGLVRSTRGSHGGYVLAMSPQEMAVSMVIEAIEGPVQITACCDDEEVRPCDACQVVQHCPITSKIRWLNDQVVGLFRGVTLADMIEPEVDVPSDAIKIIREPDGSVLAGVV